MAAGCFRKSIPDGHMRRGSFQQAARRCSGHPTASAYRRRRAPGRRGRPCRRGRGPTLTTETTTPPAPSNGPRSRSNSARTPATRRPAARSRGARRRSAGGPTFLDLLWALRSRASIPRRLLILAPIAWKKKRKKKRAVRRHHYQQLGASCQRGRQGRLS
jgi:hypothetical protein